ncbi:MAG TPA: RsmE family RNA methyltransferase [Bryobacteraceae bacterium]|nr:RsmE family RNA methyltransferase [Bryobacteraceae bacterium]
MARRLFFVAGVHSGRAEIVGDDAGHLTKVLRVEPGQRYEISDNEALYLAEVETARRAQVVFRVLDKLQTRQPPVRMHLLASLIKFDHFEWMLEKATELGVERITPVLAERCEKGLHQAAAKRGERWRRILRESSQQSRRWRVPDLHDTRPLRNAIRAEGLRYALEEQADAPPLLACLPANRTPHDEVAVLLGPEGGWTNSERAAIAEADWLPVSLGPTILRAETAATAALAVIAAAWSVST